MAQIGDTIGRFRIRDYLGRGGMGEVYGAWDETLQRRVALKSIRPDRRFDADVKRRFLREARVLSQLDHPTICRLYGFVEHADGDFLVLERIDGRRLSEVLRDGPTRTRAMAIARRIADALAAAHAQGVAHRDLKPDNVMLTADGAVKVLDFGLALVASEADTAPAVEPSSAQAPSPDAARPQTRVPTARRATTTLLPPHLERAARPASSAGGRTAAGTVMGTVGYMSPEQARGERATPASDLFSFGLLLQELFTGRPARPEGRPAADRMRQAAEGRADEAPELDPELRDLVSDLCTYTPSARPTADAVRRRLAGIANRGPRRRRLAVAALLAVVLLSAMVRHVIVLQRERAAAIEARRDAEQIADFLRDVFAGAQPIASRGRDVTAHTLLERGVTQLDRLADQPRQRARLMATIGQAYRQLGSYDEARPLLEAALAHFATDDADASDPRARIDALDQLASLERETGQLTRAETLFDEARTIRQRHFGAQHPHVAVSLNNLAVLARARGDDARAARLLREALAIQQANAVEPAELASGLSNLGDLLRLRGELGEADALITRAIDLQRAHLGPGHPNMATSLNNLAVVRQARGAVDDAEQLHRQALAMLRQVLGDDHPQTAASLANLANLRRATGRFDDAIARYRVALAVQTRALGPQHPSVVATQIRLADVHRAIGETADAETLYAQAWSAEPSDPRLRARARTGLAALAARAGDDATALAHHRAAHDAQAAMRERDPHFAGIGLAAHARLLVRRGALDDAEALLAHAQPRAAARLAQAHDSREARARMARLERVRGDLHRARGDDARAHDVWAQALARVAQATSAPFVDDLALRASLLEALGRAEDAAPLRAQLDQLGWRAPDPPP
ncbi:MAG: serine/threonine-protein kinase [Acidobacteriota bacterium]